MSTLSTQEPAEPLAADPAPGVTDAFKDLVKGTIALPLEGCKSMATGCATVAGIYGAVTAFVNSGHQPTWEHWQIYAALVPFVLWSIAGYQFGTAYLPNVRLTSLLSTCDTQPDARAQWTVLVEREAQLRDKIVRGSRFFWAALAWAVACVALVRIP